MSERDKVAATVERLRIVLAQLQTPSTSSFSISQNDIKRGEDLLWQYELQREHVEARVVNQRGIVALLKSLAHVSHDQPNQLLTQACSDAVAFLEAREQYLSTIANGYDEESPPWPLLCKQLEQRVRHLEKRNQEWEISCKRLTTQAHDSETRSQRAFAEISRLVGMMYDDQWFSESCVLLQLLLLVEMTHPKAITVVVSPSHNTFHNIPSHLLLSFLFVHTSTNKSIPFLSGSGTRVIPTTDRTRAGSIACLHQRIHKRFRY
eukprot:c5580_g1_i1.p1 GENE.c5580_g1_i1~~c5580_g1_i1.p1  ORF type:complete len:276 (-),score=12.30 c5580_g1_i1:389-1177(-)